MEIFCFFIGILYAYTHHFILPFLGFCIWFMMPKTRIILFLIAGFGYAQLHEYNEAPKGMPQTPTITNAIIEGTIISIPIRGPYKTQFTMNVDTLNGKPVFAIAQIAWYNKAPMVHAKERWRLKVKLKKPHNFQNPGSYDYEQSLKTKHIQWTGYTLSGNERLYQDGSLSWLALREQLNNQLALIAPDTETAGIVQSLTLNTTTLLSQAQWDLFRRTGTTHLFGISGEHIALIWAVGFFLIRRLWSLSASCCLLIPAQRVAAFCALLIALCYAQLTGFAPPVQRALIGCALYAWSYSGTQRFTPWQAWRYALFAVLVIEPHAVFMQGFYFSFLAVVLLLATHQRFKLKGYKNTLALQLSCLIGLLPLSLYWFSYGSLNGFAANLFAIPLVGFVLIPLSLLAMLVCFFSGSQYVMALVSWGVHLLLNGLTLTEHLAGINITWGMHSIIQVLSLLGALFLFILFPIPVFRRIAILWFILTFYPPKSIIQEGDALINVLDVGQGLSVNIQTQHHTLLYDTGDKFFQGSDLGQMVVLPFYKVMDVKKMDAIVLSHPDKDHVGGLVSIEKELPPERLIVSQPSFYHRGFDCHHYPEWEWDGVRFAFLPILEQFSSKNNNSCVLKVSSRSGSMLLAGDIERVAEDYLINLYGEQLRSDVLLLPHHGSKTSSSYRFVATVAPRFAIASIGFDNRFRFPHAKTLATLALLNVPFYRTDELGMISVRLSKEHGVDVV